MLDADGITLASPTYFTEVSSETKALIDRAGWSSPTRRTGISVGGDLARWARRGGKVGDLADARRRHSVVAEEAQRRILHRHPAVGPVAATDVLTAGGGGRTAFAAAGKWNGAGLRRR